MPSFSLSRWRLHHRSRRKGLPMKRLGDQSTGGFGRAWRRNPGGGGASEAADHHYCTLVGAEIGRYWIVDQKVVDRSAYGTSTISNRISARSPSVHFPKHYGSRHRRKQIRHRHATETTKGFSLRPSFSLLIPARRVRPAVKDQLQSLAGSPEI